MKFTVRTSWRQNNIYGENKGDDIRIFVHIVLAVRMHRVPPNGVLHNRPQQRRRECNTAI